MTEKAPQETERIRAAEVIAASCLATDLGMGFPFEHGLHATLMTMRLADLLGVDSETASQTYYASLLMYSGCTTDAEVAIQIFGGGMTKNVTHRQFGSATETLKGVVRALPSPDSSPLRRAAEVAWRLPKATGYRKPHFTAMCEVATMLAERLGLPPSVNKLFAFLTERWDGKGILDRATGEEIPLPLRIVHTARDAAYQRLIGSDEQVVDTIRQRAGHAFDPEIANLLADEAGEVLAAADAPESVWEATLAVEPRPWLTLEGEAIDRALAAMGDFADLVSPSLAGHSKGVADLASTAAGLVGLDTIDAVALRRAALVHDVGRVAAHPKIWQKPGPLTPDEWEHVRLHAYHTGRILFRSPFLASLADVACAHHERLDGSGYHRGVNAGALPPAARLLAVADAFHAMIEPRPYREPLSPEKAAAVLGEEAKAGRQDPGMVAAVLEAAGQPSLPVERPAGLTEREVEIVGLLAQGLQTKQMARALDISVKTADRHIQNAYRKIGVSTRAAATLFAAEHGLVPWGELPITRGETRP